MKKLMLLSAALLMATAAAFAGGQKDGPDAPGPQGHPGMGPQEMMNLEPGTQVIHEYKKLTGQILISDRLIPAIKAADGIEYTLTVPMRAYRSLGNVKHGDTAAVEGLSITVKKADGKTESYFHPVKGTVAGKEFDMSKMMPPGHEKGMMGRGDGRGEGRGEGRGPGPCGNFNDDDAPPAPPAKK